MLYSGFFANLHITVWYALCTRSTKTSRHTNSFYRYVEFVYRKGFSEFPYFFDSFGEKSSTL